MTKKEKELFIQQITQYLTDQRKYNEVDRNLICLFVDEVALCQELNETLIKEGQILAGTNGMKYAHPAAKLKNASTKNVLTIGKMIGISPMARKMVNMHSDEKGRATNPLLALRANH